MTNDTRPQIDPTRFMSVAELHERLTAEIVRVPADTPAAHADVCNLSLLCGIAIGSIGRLEAEVRELKAKGHSPTCCCAECLRAARDDDEEHIAIARALGFDVDARLPRQADVLARIATIRGMGNRLADAALLFHDGGGWDPEKQRQWTEATGETDATTRTLCDLARLVRASIGR